MNSTRPIELLTIGRSSIDLYSANIGSPFENIQSFNAFVGGCPLNIATGAKRLGLNSALLTGVGKDKVGDFILNFLKNETIQTDYVQVMPEHRSSAVILGIEPPDRFPLVYYRDNCADVELTIDHIESIPFDQVSAVVFSGTAFSKDPSRTAMYRALERAREHEVITILDIDFRADQWADVRAFGVVLRSVLHQFSIVVGTEEELLACFLKDKNQLAISHQQISAPEIKGDISNGIQHILEAGVHTLIIKRGKEGASIFQLNEEEIKVPGFPVEVLNVLGAGDAFCAGLSYALLRQYSLYHAVRMGNACGAIIVTREGCANFMPTLQEVEDFIASKGGL